MSQTLYEQNRLYLLTKLELKLHRDRTRLYNAHRSWQGQVRPRSRQLLQQAQYRARQRIQDSKAKNRTNKKPVPKDPLAKFFKPVEAKPEKAHSLLCQAVDRLLPDSVYVSSKPLDCPSLTPKPSPPPQRLATVGESQNAAF